jgi:hypothetical protein
MPTDPTHADTLTKLEAALAHSQVPVPVEGIMQHGRYVYDVALYHMRIISMTRSSIPVRVHACNHIVPSIFYRQPSTFYIVHYRPPASRLPPCSGSTIARQRRSTSRHTRTLEAQSATTAAYRFYDLTHMPNAQWLVFEVRVVSAREV